MGLEVFDFDTRDEWLEARKSYVTATEVAQLIRRSQSYWDELRDIKSGRRQAPDIGHLPAVKHGRAREEHIMPELKKADSRIEHNEKLFVLHGKYAATPENGMIRLDDKGLWDLRAMVTASWVALGQNAQVYLRVLKPDGETVYSEQAYFISTITTATMTLVSSVVIPSPGYYVDVWVAAASARGWWTGPQWTRLTAQHISRSTEGGTGAEKSTPGSDKDDDGNVDSGKLSGSKNSPGVIGSVRGSL